MKIKRIVIPTITMLMIASCLTGCASSTSKEMLSMLENQQSITIEVAEPTSIEQGTKIEDSWVELALLDNYIEFRKLFDDTLNITTFGSGGKNGVIYIDTEGNQTNNSTLANAFNNEKFINNYWNNSDVSKLIAEAAKVIYTDVESDRAAIIAAYNAYFNILADSEPGYANLNSTLTRIEAMSAIYKAVTPVNDIEADEAFISAVSDKSNLAIYAANEEEYSFLQTSNKSLDENTANGVITRAEFIYILSQQFYSDEYKGLTGKESAYSDTKNGGDIAAKQKFIVTDKKTGAITAPDRWQAYELSYAIQDEKAGLPDDLYKAMVVAKNHNLITTDDSRWSEGLTKGEAIEIIIKVLESQSPTVNADRGQATGEAINTEALQSTTSNGSLEVEEEGLGVYFNKDKIRLESDGTYTMAADTYEYLMNFNGISEIPEDKLQQFIEDISPILISGIFDDPSDLQNYITELSSIYTTPTNTTPSNTESSSSTTETPTQTPTPAPSEPSTPAPSTPESGVDDVDYQEGLIIDYSDSGEEINMEFDDEDDPAYKIEPGAADAYPTSGYIRAK